MPRKLGCIRMLAAATLASGAGLGSAALAAPTVGGCQVFPAYNYWNTRVDNLPLHPKSTAWVNSIGASARMHPDWGNVLADNFGIPFVTVTPAQPNVPILFNPDGSEDESDAGPYPVPADAPVEGGAASNDDRHVLVAQSGTCILYELYRAFPNMDGSWTVDSSAKYNLASNALRPAGNTSADAAGLPILPGLVRWDEVASGEIRHAIRFTAPNIWGVNSGNGSHVWLWPARHWSGSLTDSNLPPMGARFRLKASFDITPYDPVTQVILRAMKKYGIVLADGGSSWFFQGVSDTNWPDAVFDDFTNIVGGNMEAVDTSYLQVDVNSGQAVQFATMGTNFNLDPRSDLLYRNVATGQVYRFFGNGLSLGAGAPVYSEPNLAWKIVADADFNGDGVDDLLWRNTSTGQVFLLTFGANGMPSGGGVIYTEPDQNWKIVAAPDFDGDGKADMLWWNSSTGKAYAILVKGFALGAAGLFYTEPNTNWKIVAVGDFAGSGKRNQLLWRNATTGQVFLMTVNATGGAFTQSGQQIYQEPDLTWKIVAAADFDGDGKTDIVWRNDVTGQVYMMLMNGPTIAAATQVYVEPNTAWKIVAQGDYNGDGKSDLLWRNDATGQVYMMLMNGLSVGPSAPIYTEPNTAWHLMGALEYAQ